MFRLLCGPARSGKTSDLLSSFLAAYTENPLRDDLLVLVPGNVAAEELRRRLIHMGNVSGIIGSPFHTLLDAARACRSPQGTPGRELWSAEQHFLLRDICAALVREGRLSALAHMLEHPGTFASLAALITELRDAQIDAADLCAAAPRVAAAGYAAASERCEAIAEIVTRYVETCRRLGLVDRQEIFAQALARLHSGEPAPWQPLRHLFIDGFYEFNPLQWSFVQALIKRAENVTATLLYEPDRPEMYGIVEPMFARLSALADEVELEPLDAGARSVAEVAPPLIALERGLFSRDDPTPVEAAGAIEIHSGGDAASAFASLVAACKRSIRQQVCRPGEIGIVLRQLDARRLDLCRALETHGLPFHCTEGVPLGEQAVVRFCDRVLRLILDDWPASGVLDVMTSPYYRLAPNGNAAEVLESAPRRAAVYVQLRAAVVQCGIRRGFADWQRRLAQRQSYLRQRIDRSAENHPASSGSGVPFAPGTPDLVAQLAAHEDACAHFAALFETANNVPQKGEAEQLAEAVCGLLASVGIAEAIASTEDESLQERDRRLWQAWNEEVRETAQVLALLGAGGQIELSTFCELLGQRLAERRVHLAPEAADAIMVTDVNTARQRHFEMLAVGSLEVRSFPLAVRQSALLPDEVRSLINDSLGARNVEPRLDISTQRQREERLLFYLCVTRPSKLLHLGYTCADEAAPLTGRSQYVAEVERLVAEAPHEHRPAASVALPQEKLWRSADLRVATFARLPREALDALHLAALRRQAPSGLAPQLQLAPLWDSEDGGDLYRMLAALRVEHRRLDGNDHSRWSGRMDSATVMQALGQMYGGACQFSATALTEYGKCRFRYFAGRLLRLEPAASAAEEIGAADVGNLEHHILERFYAGEGAAQRLPIPPNEVGAARDRLRRCAEPVFHRYEIDNQPIEAARWQAVKRDILRRLGEFIGHDAAYSIRRSGRVTVPVHFEIPFGALARLGVGSEAAGTALSINVDGATVYLRGIIDRIDYVYDVDKAGEWSLRGFEVIDYKHSQHYDKPMLIDEGTTFQLPVYLWAAQQRLPETAPLAAGYASLKRRQHSFLLDARKADDPGAWASGVIAQTRRHIAAHVTGMRNGVFDLAPRRCEDTCPYRSACRINVVRPNAGEQSEEP